MKYFACSDIHGDWTALQNAIAEFGYDENNPNHTLIVCGDCFGRASVAEDDCEAIYRYLISDCHANKPIVLRGNHEDILSNIFRRNKLTYADYYNGEHKTIASLGHVDLATAAYTPLGLEEVRKHNPQFVLWLNTLPFYFETEKYIFTHAWLPKGADWRNADKETWVDATWSDLGELVYLAEVDEKYPEKTLVFGHFGTYIFRGGLYNRWEDCKLWRSPSGHFIGLDNTTVINHRIDMLVIEDKAV